MGALIGWQGAEPTPGAPGGSSATPSSVICGGGGALSWGSWLDGLWAKLWGQLLGELWGEREEGVDGGECDRLVRGHTLEVAPCSFGLRALPLIV